MGCISAEHKLATRGMVRRRTGDSEWAYLDKAGGSNLCGAAVFPSRKHPDFRETRQALRERFTMVNEATVCAFLSRGNPPSWEGAGIGP